ncbi:uncharacterized protein LOC128883283 [Hylaeus volcanicus]|uniref:uncharacterized protein LOC128883283 n=1 Tax=Hylaeus volcanicus TaxID=313075 RepID=UPI0023B87D71|nr:uncharacterized protein LOC128883283 [Hylaeus volcanicus]XP_053991456.1 uncharacterized protein LOC128883283 [Hylaeus volcanicus]XP_053991457.1 uncharacterized protein LOC128883283 [Hylaeus volcanicus]
MFFSTSSHVTKRYGDEEDFNKRESVLFSLSQNSSSTPSESLPSNTSGSTPDSIVDTSTSRKTKQQLQPPCRAMTIELLKKNLRNMGSDSTKMYEESGPVSLLGWPMHLKTIQLNKSGESQFMFCDGTGIVNVRLMLYSDNEEYLSRRMAQLFDVSSSSCVPSCSEPILYLRVVGTVAPDMKDSTTLRCIHIRKAKLEEIAFYHTFDVIDTFLRQEKKHSTTVASTTVLHSEYQREFPGVSNQALNLDHVQLPDTFSLCKENPCQYTVLQYIMKHRQKYKGVLLKDLFKHFSGMFQEQDLRDTIQTLTDMAFCMETDEGYVDLVIDEEED